jgi:hypothetical protein
MSRLSDERLAKARQVDFATILHERGIRLLGRWPNLCGPCPQCGGRDRFGVNLKKQVFNCRICRARGGGPIDFVMFLDGCDFSGAVEVLAGAAPERTDCSISKQPALAIKKCEEKDNARKSLSGDFIWDYKAF